MSAKAPLGITELVLRDAHQSLLATRLRLDDMLPIASTLDRVGFWSIESWGGATFDAAIRYLGEDPWERLRSLKAAMPATPQQMLLRGQNLLGYRHYADDVVEAFVERAAINGVDVFRVFDALNDTRNLQTALRAAVKRGKHAQGTIAFTVSPVHTIDGWVDLARRIEDLGAHSLCIKDMAGLLTPYVAFDLVGRLKATLSIPVHLHCHATTGLSTATYLKAIEAGVDSVDCAISSMSMTYGHSATESVVAILAGTERDTGLDLPLLEQIAGYFREVRKKYGAFEGSLRGVDSRILVAQVPGGMLTNLESQLRDQQQMHRFDEVLAEIPAVRADLGQIPLVTPTSQIVGSQAVLNVLAGERYASLTRETVALLRGEYGATPAAVDRALQTRALAGKAPITQRPADLLAPEMARLEQECLAHSRDEGFGLAEAPVDDLLTYALFGQTALKFLKHRGDPTAFEPPPSSDAPPAATSLTAGVSPPGIPAGTHDVVIDGQRYTVHVTAAGAATVSGAAGVVSSASGTPVAAPLAGNVVRILVKVGESVLEGDPLVVLEAMKMEMEVSAPCDAVVEDILVVVGSPVSLGEPLVDLR